MGHYILHYADDTTLDLPITYGQDIWNWWVWGLPEASMEPGGAIPVWIGSNKATRRDGAALRLYKSTRLNPRTDAELVSIDFVSDMSATAPFLVALTVE